VSYRIMHITGGYPNFLQGLLEGVPTTERSYDRLFRAFVDSRWGWSDYWVRGFRESGHAAEMVVCNFEALQKAWAVEHCLSYDEAHWAQQILLAQIKAWKPDVIWIQDLYFISADWRRLIREQLPNVILLGWRFSVTHDMESLRDLDVIITGADAYADSFRKSGIPAETVPLFFPEAIMDHVLPVKERSLPFIFCGTVGKADGWHSRRYRMIEELLVRTPLDVFTGKSGGESGLSWREFLLRVWPQGVKEKLPARLRHRFSLQTIYPDRFHAAVFGLDYFRLLGDAQICFNAHIDMAMGFAGNMRMFEATGMGACLLTDWKPNITEFFEPDREIVVYRTPEEAVEKAQYLLAHREEREAIAKRGQNRVLRDHTMVARLGKMDEIISRAVKMRVSLFVPRSVSEELFCEVTSPREIDK